MKTVIVSVPDNEEGFFNQLMKKFKFRWHVLAEQDLEEDAIAKWIDEGMKSKDMPAAELYKFLKENGVTS